MRNRRDRRQPYGQVMFVTARVRKGLPFVGRDSVKRVLIGIIARGQRLSPVKVCAFVFMGNHYHMIITGQSHHFSPFMNFIQGEISKAMQKLIPNFYHGRFWEGRFSEQRIFTPEDVINKMAYIFTNPINSRLVRSIQDYPGLNSFRQLTLGGSSLLCPWIPSSKLKGLPECYNKKEDLRIVVELLDNAVTREELRIEPFAWLNSFSEVLTEENVLKRLMAAIGQAEKECPDFVIGRAKLQSQPLRKKFDPSKKEYTPHLICYDKELRLREILSFREFCRTCREAWALLKKGIHTVWPKGAYRPGMRWGPIPAS